MLRLIIPIFILAACTANKKHQERHEPESQTPVQESANPEDSDDKTSDDTTTTTNPTNPTNPTTPSTTTTTCTNETLGIVNGQTVKEKTLIARSTGQLWLNDSDCTATLIGPRHMVTAAHCFPANDTPIEARFGLKSATPDLKIPIEKWVIHPLWKESGTPYDVAVFTLKTAVPSTLVPVPIANPDELKIGVGIIITGYGTASENAQTSLPLSWVSVPLESVSIDGRYFSTVINGKASCYGDSGGPGYIVDPSTQCLKAVGAVSVASIKGNGICGQGDTMMDLTRYKGWISASFEQLGAPLSGLPKDGSESAASQNQVKSL